MGAVDDRLALEDAAVALAAGGTFIGRVHLPSSLCPAGIGGPTPVLVTAEGLFDLSDLAPTVAELLALRDVVSRVRTGTHRCLGTTQAALAESVHTARSDDQLYLLSPVDLQPVKACGVTFATSLVERLVDERARGQPDDTQAIREAIASATGGRLEHVRAGTPAAINLLEELRRLGIESAYLEVGLGPYAEVFTKAQVLASVGTGELVHVRDDAAWTNPEPEMVLVVDPQGSIVGATLGNDVNLRDLEGRSPLLLGIAKDNTASAAIGPWIRLFDDTFRLDDLLDSTVSLQIHGDDGYLGGGDCAMGEISRHPADLVTQASGRYHQYPDGFVLFLGTMVIAAGGRGPDGTEFTHRPGDRVTIRHSAIGQLVNWVTGTNDAPPWSIGISQLTANLSSRGLLARATAASSPPEKARR